MKIEIRPITTENESVLSLPNEPFREEGLIIPLYDGKTWSYRIEAFPEEQVRENCFPDEHYTLANMKEGFNGLAVYADGTPAGFALLFDEWNKWLYLDNLLVLKAYRRKGLGTALIDAAMKLAEEKGKLGVWLVCQNDNLGAARFYFQNGFALGGMDLRRYEGTKQAGKGDLHLYRSVEK